MKSSIRFVILLVLGSMAWAAQSVPALSQSFTVTNAQGDSEVGPSQGSYKPVRVQSPYQIPSWGKTGDDSFMTISFNASNSFHLLPNSEAQVRGENDTDSQWHRVIKLNIGTATFDHSSTSIPRVKLECETPTAICGAAGTQFRVETLTGTFTVSSGSILISSHSETALAFTTSASSVIYAPGKQNSYSSGTVNGYAEIAGARFRANGARFIVSKKLGAHSETAVRILSGSLNGTSAGDYYIDGSKLTPFAREKTKAVSSYLAAAQNEGQINVTRAAYLASRKAPPVGYDSGSLSAAVTAANARRADLFNRIIYQTISRETGDAIRDNH